MASAFPAVQRAGAGSRASGSGRHDGLAAEASRLHQVAANRVPGVIVPVIGDQFSFVSVIIGNFLAARLRYVQMAVGLCKVQASRRPHRDQRRRTTRLVAFGRRPAHLPP